MIVGSGTWVLSSLSLGGGSQGEGQRAVGVGTQMTGRQVGGRRDVWYFSVVRDSKQVV